MLNFYLQQLNAAACFSLTSSRVGTVASRFIAFRWTISSCTRWFEEDIFFSAFLPFLIKRTVIILSFAKYTEKCCCLFNGYLVNHYCFCYLVSFRFDSPNGKWCLIGFSDLSQVHRTLLQFLVSQSDDCDTMPWTMEPKMYGFRFDKPWWCVLQLSWIRRNPM